MIEPDHIDRLLAVGATWLKAADSVWEQLAGRPLPDDDSDEDEPEGR